MNFSLNLGNWNSIFAVPTCIVDKHIKLAGSAQLKVLLWVLRYSGTVFSIDDIASFLSMHPADVKDALQYWTTIGVISINENTIVPSNNTSQDNNSYNIISDNNAKLQQQAAPCTQKTKRAISRPQKPNSVHVAERINGAPEIAFLMQEAQIILGRPISNGDSAILLMLHDNDGLPVDVIIMILQYAVNNGKSNMKYIEKIAIDWAAEEIDTLEKAENKIRQLEEQKKCWTKLENIIGIAHRAPTAKESEMANRWINIWHFNSDLIKEAYDRCVNSQGKYVPSYMDAIIKRWHNSGIRTINRAIEETFNGKSKSKQKSSYSASYNIEEYENSSIFDE